MMELNIENRPMRSPEEGRSAGAGPGTTYANGQRRGRPRAPRREQTGNVPRPEPASATESGTSTSTRRIRPDNHRSSVTTPPTQSASSGLLPTTTRAGLPRQRMKWTIELNEELVRCYFISSKVETDLSAYRSEMRRLFLTKYPTLSNLTEQRLADQRRAVFQRNLVSDFRREEIKDQVRLTLVLSSPETDDNNTVDSADPVNPVEDEHFEQLPSKESAQLTELKYQFHKAIAEFEGTPPEKRPLLPRLKCSKEVFSKARSLNDILGENVPPQCTFHELHLFIYCGAAALVRSSGCSLKSRLTAQNVSSHEREPPWKIRLDRKIETLRKNLGRLVQWNAGNKSRRLTNKVLPLIRSLHQHASHEDNNVSVEDCLDTLKQRLQVLVKRRTRYMKSYRRKKENAWFFKNERGFYRNIEGTPKNVNVYPSPDDFYQYWSSIWGVEDEHNRDAHWLRNFEESLSDIPTMNYTQVTYEDIKSAIAKTPNWKAPGIDGIHNFYLKNFICIYPHLSRHFTEFISKPDSIPSFFLCGETYFIPKDSNSGEPQSFRPITCLPSLYKILSAILAHKISQHCATNKLIAEQQKGCAELSKGCKEQLIIDSVITSQAVHCQRNLFAAYIDYKKAFDSVPHSWLLYVLNAYKVSPAIINWVNGTMQHWKTTLRVAGKQIALPEIRIKKGIFQGDSLSPLMFCLALNPLSFLLNRCRYGYAIRHDGENMYKLSHLLYMDDLKLYASSPQHLQQLLSITATFSKDIKMDFGLNKCRTQSLQRGVQSVVGFQLGNNMIDPLQPYEHYSYLGFQQTKGTDRKVVKEYVINKFVGRLKRLLQTELNSGNLIRAVNTYAVPVLTYTFGVIKWSATDLKNVEIKMRTQFSKHRKLHPRSAIERFVLPRKLGGRGVANIRSLHDRHICELKSYFRREEENSPLKHAIAAADAGFTPLHLSRLRDDEVVADETAVLLDCWKQKSLHGRYPNEVFSEEFDLKATHAWLVKGSLFPETEGFLIGIQDQVILTRNYKKYIMGVRDVDDNCRRCHVKGETIQHITSGCSQLAPSEYKKRHDNVAKILHIELAVKYGLTRERQPYYQYNPPNLIENGDYTLYWDRTLYSDHAVMHNRPDITLIDKKRKRGFLIDIAVPNRHNVIEVYQEKIRKYVPLCIEVKEVWGLTNGVCVVPIVLSSTGEVPKSLCVGLEKLDVEPELVTIIQKAVILDTCAIVRRFLSIY